MLVRFDGHSVDTAGGHPEHHHTLARGLDTGEVGQSRSQGVYTRVCVKGLNRKSYRITGPQVLTVKAKSRVTRGLRPPPPRPPGLQAEAPSWCVEASLTRLCSTGTHNWLFHTPAYLQKHARTPTHARTHTACPVQGPVLCFCH